MIIFNFKNILLACLTFVAFTGCEDTYDPYPEFQPVPHGFGQYEAGTPTSFFFGDNNAVLKGDLQWVSIDGLVSVDAMDLYVTWSESYLDQDGIPKTAAHGKRKLKTLPAGSERTPQAFSYTATDVYNLFNGIKYDYGDGAGERDVFANPKDSDRKSSAYFTPNDEFILSWGFNATNGKYYDSWSGGICNNTIGANCQLAFNVVCKSALAGTYEYRAIGWCGTEKTGTVELREVGTGVYEPYMDGEAEPDFSFSAYDVCYGEGSTLPGGSLRLNDVCNKLSYSGQSRWGETYEFRELTVTGNVLYISWKNDYDPEAGEVYITRTDGSNWPGLTR